MNCLYMYPIQVYPSGAVEISVNCCRPVTPLRMQLVQCHFEDSSKKLEQFSSSDILITALAEVTNLDSAYSSLMNYFIGELSSSILPSGGTVLRTECYSKE